MPVLIKKKGNHVLVRLEDFGDKVLTLWSKTKAKKKEKQKKLTPPGLEPGTACVLDRSDNQLHHKARWLIHSRRTKIFSVIFVFAVQYAHL